jgi:acyl-CoA thioesterase FadM
VYPLVRFWLEMARARRLPPLALDGVHHSRHTCLPWDIDLWRELNNGRTLTLYDLGRVALMRRKGVTAALRREGWGAAVAGASVRYRRRVRALERFEVRSRIAGRCRRFFYVHQSMWREGEALSAVLIRMAMTGERGIVPPEDVLAAVGAPDWRPALPPWIEAWIEAEAARPWPPAP